MILSTLYIMAIAAVIIGCLALIDGTGVPSKDNARTGTAGQALADTIVTPQPLTDSFSGVVAKLLEEYEGEAVIVIDPAERKVVATTDGTKATAIKAAVALAAAKTCTLTPEQGQTGKALTWTRVDGADVDSDDATKAVLNAITAAVPPKRSVESIVSLLISSIGNDNYPDGPPFPAGTFIVVDQINGNLIVNLPATEQARQALSDALAAVDPATTDMAGVELSADSTPDDPVKPIFEGGSTGP